MAKLFYKDLADGARGARYAAALVDVLGQDARARAVYAEWRRDHQLDRSFPNLQAFKDAVLCDRERDLERLDRFVRGELELPFDWLGLLLLCRFHANVLNEITGRNFVPALDPPVDDTQPKGRGIRNNGDHVVRDVEWFYRRKIKRPPDQISKLAAEYAAAAQRHNDARSVVQNGIKRVEEFLSPLYIGTAI